jgi:hypothetical protein
MEAFLEEVDRRNGILVPDGGQRDAGAECQRLHGMAAAIGQ